VAVELPESAVLDNGVIAMISTMSATAAAHAHQLVITPIAGGLTALTEGAIPTTN
jgi:hypothetical protein